MIVALTVLLSLLFQIHTIFSRSDSDFIQKLQIVKVLGQRFDENKINDLVAIEGVEHVLPVSNAAAFPWVNITMDDYAVLPVYISYYDPDHSSFFMDQKLMKQKLEKAPDAIVSAEFVTNILSSTQYRRAFGLEQPVSLEMMGAAASKLVKQYQTLSLSGEYINNENLEVTGHILSFSNEHKYFTDSITNIPVQSTAKITGQLKADMLDLTGNRILLPAPSSRFFSEAKERTFFDMVYLKAESNDALPAIVSQLKTKGYIFIDNAQQTKDSLTGSSKFLRQISVIMLVILLISILNFINTLHSSIEERRKEIALKKAIGASDGKIMLGFVLEGVILVSFALVTGFSIVTFGFYFLRRLVLTGGIPSIYYEAFQLDRNAMELIFHIPPQVLISVTAGLYALCVLSSALPVRLLVQKSYMTLMRRG
jgi:ABC-type antimicrobial peptide transport system permease subunit